MITLEFTHRGEDAADKLEMNTAYPLSVVYNLEITSFLFG